jgi:pimeloyl-ACP methyl ester carboxylesterase
MADGPDDFPVAPLAHLDGARPPAPDWFERAMAAAPEVLRVDVGGAGVEALAWGERGRPGLVLLHGAGGHAGWWRALAPSLAEDFRVVAFSLSGMGGSDWRERYDFDLYADELFAVAEAAGLFESGRRPVAVGHSFGGRVGLRAAARDGDRLKAAVIVDSIIRSPGAPSLGRGLWEARPTKVSATLAQALARFRLAPQQPCENLFLVDAIARESLAAPRGGGEGWTWRFDPWLWANLQAGPPAVDDLLAVGCPTALIFADRSRVMRGDQVAQLRALAPHLPVSFIPEAEHHIMLDQPLALVAALRSLLSAWPGDPP